MTKTGRQLFGLMVMGACACSPTVGGGDGGLDGGAQVVDAGAPDAGSAFVVPSCLQSENGGVLPGDVVDSAGTARMRFSGSACHRTFVLSTTATLRDPAPPNPRTLDEQRPSLSSGNAMFDGLFQLALAESAELSVSQVHDGSFNGGASVPCGGCFETGFAWTFVWTRDTAYASELGLGFLDPQRAANSLAFKLSPLRDGGSPQIIQDTGTGGSYPVSSDRVVWALGARELLLHLTGEARRSFRDRAFEAIVDTEAQDREEVFDAADGLFRGEQSFLDWREQSYPSWEVPNVQFIATCKSLSNNLAHLALLELAAQLALEKGDARSATWAARADELRALLAVRFWLPEQQLFSAYLPTALDAAPTRRFDLLGNALAIVLGVASDAQGQAVMAHYPLFAFGSPVIFPEQQLTPIYHNRAIWPFVTAYAARAARKVGNGAAFDAHLRSLVRGAALNASNMENLELVSGTTWLADGATSGPVLDSSRQLWSVAGYVSMVVKGLLGLELVDTKNGVGLLVAPFVPRQTRRALFGDAATLVLNDLAFQDRRVSVRLRFPPLTDGGGNYTVDEVRLNGVVQPRGAALMLEQPRNLVDVVLAEPAAPSAPITFVADVSNYRVLFGPLTPSVTSVHDVAGLLAVTLDGAGENPADVTFEVFRDGQRIVTGLPGTTTFWQDSAPASGRSACYTAVQKYVATGTVSHHAEPVCWWGTGASRIVAIPSANFTVVGGTWTTDYGHQFYRDWGAPGDTLQADFLATRTGPHLVQVRYGNGAGPVTSGITCAVKRLRVTRDDGVSVGDGPLIMPQRGTWNSWGDSTFVPVTFEAGRRYSLVISDDPAAINMSAFSFFAGFTSGVGGVSGAYDVVNIFELDVLSLVE